QSSGKHEELFAAGMAMRAGMAALGETQEGGPSAGLDRSQFAAFDAGPDLLPKHVGQGNVHHRHVPHPPTSHWLWRAIANGQPEHARRSRSAASSTADRSYRLRLRPAAGAAGPLAVV